MKSDILPEMTVLMLRLVFTLQNINASIRRWSQTCISLCIMLGNLCVLAGLQNVGKPKYKKPGTHWRELSKTMMVISSDWLIMAFLLLIERLEAEPGSKYHGHACSISMKWWLRRWDTLQSCLGSWSFPCLKCITACNWRFTQSLPLTLCCLFFRWGWSAVASDFRQDTLAKSIAVQWNTE